jgi:succinyl-diaminopimelate desuccinylase
MFRSSGTEYRYPLGVTQLDLSQGLSELAQALIDIESVSGNEAAISKSVFDALESFDHLRVIREGNAVIAMTNLDRPARVIIAGHLDTVPVAENLPSKLMHFEREQVIFGRGAVDMKGGIAVMLKLAAELVSPIYDITWIFYDNEEVAADLNGLGRIAKNHPELLCCASQPAHWLRVAATEPCGSKSEPRGKQPTPRDPGWGTTLSMTLLKP